MSITLGIFIVILLITLAITYWAAKRTSTTADFYAADSRLTAAQNGFALAGDWCSAAAFLGFTGLTALYGMDGAFYALGPLVAFCTVLFLIAEPMRNTGKYTLGDVIHSRMQTRTSLGRDCRHRSRQLCLSDAADGRRRRAGSAFDRHLL
jgi:cation/acetate symporter